MSGNQTEGVWLSIGMVSEVTGLSERQLRYVEGTGLITPRRSPSGRRRYSLKDVETLKRVGALRRQGKALGRVVKLLTLTPPVAEALETSEHPDLRRFADAQVYFSVRPPDDATGR